MNGSRVVIKLIVSTELVVTLGTSVEHSSLIGVSS